MDLVGGRLLRRLQFCETICIHEKHWTDLAHAMDIKDRVDPDICYECLDAAEEINE